MNANSFCHSLGMELASFDSNDEADWFADIFVNSGKIVEVDWCFIAGIRMFPDATKSKENWFWINSGKKINYPISWHVGQPDNNNGYQWCLGVTKNGNRTNFYADIECYHREESFICQKSSAVQITEVSNLTNIY